LFSQTKKPPPLHKIICVIRADFRGATLVYSH
jgi:hypothetical protein